MTKILAGPLFVAVVAGLKAAWAHNEPNMLVCAGLVFALIVVAYVSEAMAEERERKAQLERIGKLLERR
jgi:uncharacterized membrane protein affecting hemolysin expression